MKKIIFIFIFFITTFFANEDIRFFGAAIEGFPTIESVYKLEYEFNFTPNLIEFYIQFDKNNKNLFSNLKNSLKVLKSFEIIPVITIEPMYIEKGKEITINYEKILNKEYDNFLLSLTNEIKEIDLPIIIRFAQEMNLNRYHWGTSLKEYGPNSTEIYKKMYRYIYFFFKKENVKNALFAFCPNVESIPNESFNDLTNYYPGSDVVDLFGLDGYNFGKCANKNNMGWESKWRSFNDIFSSSLSKLKSLSNKPIIIFEMASAIKGGNREKWIEDALQDFEKFNLKGLIWFQINKECHWKINKNNEKEKIKIFFDINKILINRFFEELLNEKNKIT
ncbi:MAG: Endoglucanase H [Candidatus Anoxychlamydiales bacterium]|nr:Endoglucanase H [Candidatus Anoxychlamydiales bacterium]